MEEEPHLLFSQTVPDTNTMLIIHVLGLLCVIIRLGKQQLPEILI